MDKITFRFTFLLSFMMLVLSSLSCKSQAGGTKRAAALPPPATSVAIPDAAVTFSINDHFNGFNTQMMRGPSWHDAGFIEKVKQLHPKTIRYPGGTVASYWDWKTGWLMEGKELKMDWERIKKNPNTLDDLKFACDATGALPILVLNMMNSDLAYQMEMLRYARKIGLPVKYIELDNELYLSEPFYVKKFPGGRDYAIAANEWISAIKKEFPDARIGVVGYSARENVKSTKKYPERRANWNREVLSTIKNADAMTFHVYGGSGLNFLSRSEVDEDSEVAGKQEIYQQAFEAKGSIDFILGLPFTRWGTSKAYDYQILPANMSAWVTEYNLFEKEGVLAGTWAHGLYALIQTLSFMEDSKTELICYHNLTTSAQFAAIFSSNEGFAKASRKPATQSFGFTAAGMCLSLSGEAMMEGGKATKLKFEDNAQIKSLRGKTYPGLNGWQIKKGNETKIIVVNLSSSSIKVDFSKAISSNATYKQLTSDVRKQIANESDVTKNTGNGSMINLPGYSVTLIEQN